MRLFGSFVYTLLFLFLTLPSLSQSETGLEELQKTGVPVSFVTSPYEDLTVDMEEEIDSEIDFQKTRCKFESLKDYADILSSFSKVEALFLLKKCNSTNAKNVKQVESQAKQQIFLISKFPKLELIHPDPKNIPMTELIAQITKLWEDRIYFFSNFYHEPVLLWLGEEKEITNEINRIVYTDMNEKRKWSLLKKLSDDILRSNQRIYQLFQYSGRNPLHAKDLQEENSQAKQTLHSFFQMLSNDENMPPAEKEKIISFNDCLAKINRSTPNLRLAHFLGFWQDYEILFSHKGANESKERLSIRNFLKKNTFQSHHFTRRLEKGLNTCNKVAQLPTTQ
jgi:hypothetical protein